MRKDNKALVIDSQIFQTGQQHSVADWNLQENQNDKSAKIQQDHRIKISQLRSPPPLIPEQRCAHHPRQYRLLFYKYNILT